MSDLSAYASTLDSFYKRNSGQAPASTPVKVYGVPGSMNCMGPIMLAMDTGLGGMEMMMPYSTPESYAKITPFGQVPGLEDGDLKIQESGAILRYLAAKGQLMAGMTNTEQARDDSAMDAFGHIIYQAAILTLVYPVFGYMAEPEDKPAAAKTAMEKLALYEKAFFAAGSKGKLVNGRDASKPMSAADYKLGPFMYALAHPAVEKCNPGFVCPEWVKTYAKTFCSKSKSAGMLESAGGYALKEMMDKKL